MSTLVLAPEPDSLAALAATSGTGVIEGMTNADSAQPDGALVHFYAGTGFATSTVYFPAITPEQIPLGSTIDQVRIRVLLGATADPDNNVGLGYAGFNGSGQVTNTGGTTNVDPPAGDEGDLHETAYTYASIPFGYSAEDFVRRTSGAAGIIGPSWWTWVDVGDLWLDYVRLEVDFTPPAPVAAMSADPTSGDAPLTVEFTDSSEGLVDSRLWDFGDGATSVEASPTHVYDEPGEYEVALSVTNETGTDEASASVSVSSGVPASPFDGGSVIPGRTPAEVVAYMAVAPEWTFSTNPVKAITHASVRAAEAQRRGNQTRARFWRDVGLALCEAAGVEPGQVLMNLRNRR